MYTKLKRFPLKSVTLFLFIFWSAAVWASAAWNIFRHEQETKKIMLNVAQTSLEKEILILRWYSLHGGVYTPVEENFQPGTRSFLPGSNLLTQPPTSNLPFDLVSPPEIIRDFNKLYQSTGRIETRLVSNRPMSPGNKTDPWEEKALNLAVQEADKYSEFVKGDNHEYFLRMLLPIRAEKACLQCHTRKGHQERDLMGGISVKLPARQYLEVKKSQQQTIALAHFAIWFIGSLGVGFGYLTLARKEALRLEAENQMLIMANYDKLTGLANRNLFIDRFNHALAAAERYGSKVGLLYIDLNRLKPINDKYGHQAGDHALVTVAERLLPLVRKSDTAARVGGDEFIIVMHNIKSKEETASVAQKIIEALKAPMDFHGNNFSIGSSIGISCYPEDGKDVDELIRKADMAMYKAKKKALGGFEFA